jgi:hypothetical protein
MTGLMHRNKQHRHFDHLVGASHDTAFHLINPRTGERYRTDLPRLEKKARLVAEIRDAEATFQYLPGV